MNPNMKEFLVCLILVGGICLYACTASNSSADADKRPACPIKKETTAIRYTVASNSGIAVLIEYDITPDSLIWHYTDHRNSFTLKDTVTYDRKDYDSLIGFLSHVAFKVHKDNSIPETGGGGYSYSFFDNGGKYLGYGVVLNIATGDNKNAEEAISQFVNNHKTAGEQAVEEALEKHLLYIDVPEFPETLLPYRVK